MDPNPGHQNLHMALPSLLFSLASVNAAPPSPYGSTFGIQLHSFNDARGWNPALLKASPFSPSLFLKLDPQYLPPILCALQKRALPDPRGCLVFNHDTVGVLSRDTFNTSGDLLAWLADPANAPLTQRRNLTLSLCFKGCGGSVSCPCDSSPSSVHWLSLLDDLFSAAASLIASRGLAVRLLLDGDGNPGAHACLAQRWRPLSSVFISGDDPSGAFTSDSASQGWDRLAVLNEPLSAWPAATALRYGKFENRSEPFIVWEPSDEAGVKSVAVAYAASGTPPHTPGMLWASNTDPSQWAVFVAQAGGPGLNEPAVSAGVGGEPRLASLRPTGVGAPFALVGVWDGGNVKGALYRAWALGARAGLTPQGEPAPLPLPAPLGAPLFVQAAPTAGGGSGSSLGTVAVAGPLALQRFSLLSCGEGCQRLEPSGAAEPNPVAALLTKASHFSIATELLPCAPCPPAAAAGGGWGCNGCLLVAAVLQEADAPGCVVSAWLLPVGGGGSGNLTPTCMIAETAQLQRGNASAVSAAVVGTGGAAAGAIAVSGGGRVFGASFCSSSNGTLLVNDPVGCWGAAAIPPAAAPVADWLFPLGTVAPLPLFVGDGGLGLALLRPPSPELPPLLLSTAARSHCSNNEKDNKRADAGVCTLPPPNSAGSPKGGDYLFYSYGSLAAWGAALLGAEPALWVAERGCGGPCSGLISTGSFGMGGSGTAPVLIDENVFSTALPAEGGVSAVVLAKGAGAAGVPLPDPAGCGAALGAGEGALTVLGWPLPSL